MENTNNSSSSSSSGSPLRNKSSSSLPSVFPLRTERFPLPAMRPPSTFFRSPSPLSPGSLPSGLPSPLCPLNNEYLFGTCRSSKSPIVDLGEDLEADEQEGAEGKGEQEPTNEYLELDTSRKRKTTSDIWDHFTWKKVDGKIKTQCHHCSKLE